MKAQSAVEYLILVAFVSIAVTIVLILAYFYTSASNDSIRINQIESFANKIISYSESVYYAGEPSQSSFMVYIPKGISSATFSGNELIIEASLASGDIIRVFKSKVELQGAINSNQGSRKLTVKAFSDRVVVS